MILEYHRPDSLAEALQLLARPQPHTRPLAGGTRLNRPSPDSLAVVDVQNLGLTAVERKGNWLWVGAAVTLQALLSTPDLPLALARAIQNETTYHLRQVASVAGSLVSADGRSPFTTVFLALDAILESKSLVAGDERVSLGDLLPLRSERLAGRLITQVAFPLNVRLAFDYVARTPADVPLVCVAVTQWPSGRTRLAIGGFGPAPVLAMDGPQADGIEAAARNACHQADDEWASSEYRSQVAATLARRCLAQLAN